MPSDSEVRLDDLDRAEPLLASRRATEIGVANEVNVDQMGPYGFGDKDGHYLLIVFPGVMPDSLWRRLGMQNDWPGLPKAPVAGAPPPKTRACWRRIDGLIGVQPGAVNWVPASDSSVTIKMWFSVDAGTWAHVWAIARG